jgi:hypothetical protein
VHELVVPRHLLQPRLRLPYRRFHTYRLPQFIRRVALTEARRHSVLYEAPNSLHLCAVAPLCELNSELPVER